MFTVNVVATTHDDHTTCVGTTHCGLCGLLSTRVAYNICTAFITSRSTVKPDMLADCLLMFAIRGIHFSRCINVVLVVITHFGL